MMDELTTLTGFRAVLDSRPPMVLPAHSQADYREMALSEREDFNEQRIAWLLRRLRFDTPETKQARTYLARRRRANKIVGMGRRAIMISGPAYAGKTEIAWALVEEVEDSLAKCSPEYRRDGLVPVVWVDVLAQASPKSVLSVIIRYFAPDLKIPRDWRVERLQDMVCDLLRTHRTDVIVFDEMHNMSAKTGLGGNEASDLVKGIQNAVPATFLYAGIDLEHGQQFGTSRGEQLLQRCDVVNVSPFVGTGDDEVDSWLDLVAQFDEAIPLIGHEPGVLTSAAGELRTVCGGTIGHLGLLVNDLVLDIIGEEETKEEPHESLTRALLREKIRERKSRIVRTSGAKPVSRARGKNVA